jgi:aminoglycoside phosphotransferase
MQGKNYDTLLTEYFHRQQETLTYIFYKAREESITMEPRYLNLSAKTIKGYRDELVSPDKIEYFLEREFIPFGNVKKLTGGRINSVYKVNSDGQDKVMKFSTGVYRLNELKREAEALKYLIDKGYKHIVPNISEFMVLDNFAYLVEDYLDGATVREKLDINECLEERLKLWEEVGHVLSEIHMLCKDEDIKYKWLNCQLKIARINMENDLLDPGEFQEEPSEEILKWLVSNKPKRKQTTLLHGDFRTKNIIVNKENNCKVIDWGFVDIGDPYYDLAIIDYYFRDTLDRESFYKGYNNNQYDKGLIKYYNRLSKFINV